MVFEGSNGEIEISSNESNLVLTLNGVSTSIDMDEAIHLQGWITHQLTEIREKKRKRLPRWKQLLTI